MRRQLSPPLLKVGAAVEARYKGRLKWFKGEITARHRPSKYARYFVQEEGGGGEGTVASDPTFITGVPSAPTPVSGMGKIEERLNAVNDEQAKMRAELEAYVKEVRGRTDEAGDKLVDFPDSFDSDAEKEAKREAAQSLEPPTEDFLLVNAGYQHVCVVRADTMETVCWGNNVLLELVRTKKLRSLVLARFRPL